MSIPSTEQATRIIARCLQIAACTEVPGEITRTFLSAPTHQVHALLLNWMEATGISVHTDAAGNIRGLYPGLTPQAPRLIIGSHLDTVPNAGAYDGVLGVVLGIAMVEELRGAKLPFAIEIIGFSEEEGVRFNKAFLGSLAAIGKLDAATLAITDKDGITLSQAIQNFGLDPTQLPAAVLAQEAFAYLEIHIEQGPILESESLSLGIVSALVGQTRLQLTFTGQANHAGTTPMRLRHDAMATAADWILSVESYANGHPGLVATVGKVETHPGAGNVIAGKVSASLNVRHADDNHRNTAVAAMLEAANSAASKRGVTVTSQTQLEQAAVPMDPHLTQLLQAAAANAGFPSQLMPSGAGHDAMIIAQRLPASMLFLRSPGGLSHHPDESVLPQDVAAALATAMEFLTLLRDDSHNRDDSDTRSVPKDAHA